MSAQTDEETLGELGVTRAGRRAALVLLTVPAAIGGAALAAVVAWLVSPIMPIGLARRAEPDPGYTVDWIVLVVGGIAVTTVVLVSATITAAWLTRDRRAARTQPGPSTVATAISRARRRTGRSERGALGARSSRSCPAGAISDRGRGIGDRRNCRRAHVLGKPRPRARDPRTVGVRMGSASWTSIPATSKPPRSERLETNA